MQQRQNEITGRRGGGPLLPIAGASVTVYVRNEDGSNGSLATLYSDNGVTGRSNPLTTDQLGSYSYYAADGRYNEVISGAGIDTRTISDVLLEDPADNVRADLLGWAYAQAFRIASATRNSDGAITSASIVWPDGVTGTYTATTLSTAFPGATDAWSATYQGATALTVTQPAVTRDSSTGAVTAQPAITIA